MTERTLHELFPEYLAADAPLARVRINGIEEDSRRVKPGQLFAAVKGLHVDGHDYVAAAVAAGAAAVLVERPCEVGVPAICVSAVPQALGLAASRLYGQPSHKLTIGGITGTNGKTTTSYLVEAMLTAAGHATGVLGTISYRYPGHEVPAPYTTPTAVQIQQTFAEMREHDCSHAVMEVSSHGLAQGRLWGTEFAVAAFTHLSQDHLDFHGTMDAYLAAKLRLFTQHLRHGGTAVINVDREGAEAIVDAVCERRDLHLLRCSLVDASADATLSDLSQDLAGHRGTLHLCGATIPFYSPLVGSFNLENILLAAGVAFALGTPLPAIAQGLAALHGVPGRLQCVPNALGIAVFVDYAHTPDALVRALGVLRPLCTGRLITVFGCGGDRDRTKRPLMGQAVAAASDLAVATSDNPRSEDPQAILDEIIPGLRAGGAMPCSASSAAAHDTSRSFIVEPDRARAIALAIESAVPGDVVLLAGKGHEDYQIIGAQRLPFDDRDQARHALEKKQKGQRA